MRSKLPWALFALSFTLNIFLVAGILYALERGGPAAEWGEDRRERAAEALALTDSQQRDLQALRQRVQERWETSRQDWSELRSTMLAEVAQPEFDRERIIALIDQRAEQRRAVFADIAEALHGWLVTLTPEQRARFLEEAQERRFLRDLLGRPKPRAKNG